MDEGIEYHTSLNGDGRSQQRKNRGNRIEELHIE